MGNLLRILYAKDADANKSDIFLDFESKFKMYLLVNWLFIISVSLLPDTTSNG